MRINYEMQDFVKKSLLKTVYVSSYLARRTGVPLSTVNDILRGNACSLERAHRLSEGLFQLCQSLRDRCPCPGDQDIKNNLQDFLVQMNPSRTRLHRALQKVMPYYPVLEIERLFRTNRFSVADCNKICGFLREYLEQQMRECPDIDEEEEVFQ